MVIIRTKKKSSSVICNFFERTKLFFEFSYALYQLFIERGESIILKFESDGCRMQSIPGFFLGVSTVSKIILVI